MSRKMVLSLKVLVVISLLMSCDPRRTPTPEAGMPNPASVFCEEQGGHLDIRTDSSGSQVGTCVFPDGSECDEWAYYRGECAPAASTATQVPASTP